LVSLNQRMVLRKESWQLNKIHYHIWNSLWEVKQQVIYHLMVKSVIWLLQLEMESIAKMKLLMNYLLKIHNPQIHLINN
jgi:hypothetical protein